ncbi:unnamed protein product, partial [Nesidiocoris tenuis]
MFNCEILDIILTRGYGKLMRRKNRYGCVAKYSAVIDKLSFQGLTSRSKDMRIYFTKGSGGVLCGSPCLPLVSACLGYRTCPAVDVESHRWALAILQRTESGLTS